MGRSKTPTLSVVVPIYNEADGLTVFHAELIETVKQVTENSFEIIYCDDGSSDNSAEIVRGLSRRNQNVKLLRLSRNFGKENALTAGIEAASGRAILTLDGDGQHPIKVIPKFVKAWQAGAAVVIGVRTANQKEGWFKRLGSRLFYLTFNKITDEHLIPGSTDFRLIDRSVQQQFLKLQENERITRGLIDWLGYERKLIEFTANARVTGKASYSNKRLINLAVNSFISLSPKPLYLFGYLGVLITFFALLLGIAVFVEQLLLRDPLKWNFTGTAMLGILILFLVGIILMSQGILSLYISHIHSQSKRRPLYVIDYDRSAGIKGD